MYQRAFATASWYGFVLVVLAGLLVSEIASAQTATWIQKDTQHGKYWREHTAAYDLARERVVVFNNGETWERDRVAWTRREPQQSPPPRSDGKIAYDAARKRTILFGGTNGSLYYADTWEWDGVTWTRRQPAVSPPGRAFHGMAFDLVRQRIVLFGGKDGSTALSDTWEWDGSTWRDAKALPCPPAGSNGMTYDLARREIVLHAGGDATTWVWDGARWTNRNPPRSPPSSVYYVPVLAYDAARERVVLYGGRRDNNEVWEWDGTTWGCQGVAIGPPPRGGNAMVYDAARQAVVVLGGVGNRGTTTQPALLADVWEWDGRSWRDVSEAAAPKPRIYSALAFDDARGRLVLYGGFSNLGDTWEWNGWSWSRAQPVQSPPPLQLHAAAYDAARGTVVVFGGRAGAGSGVINSDTWQWNGANWVQSVAGARPPGRQEHALAYDAARRQIVLFGGFDGGKPLSDTWAWDGTTWKSAGGSSGPSARACHALAYDALRQRIVLFGGLTTPVPTCLADAWEWDGSSWSRRLPSNSPPARWSHGLVWDALRQRIVLHGGQDASYRPLSDTWEWDGVNWREVKTTGTPPPLGIATYDSLRKHLVLLSVGPHSTSTDPSVLTYATPAGFAITGAGCGGANGVPQIAPFGRPSPGNASFGIDLLSLRAFSPAMLVVGTHACRVPLGGGCTLYVDPGSWMMSRVALSNASGFAHLPMAIPAERRLLGMKLYAQAAAYDPGAPLKDVALSARLELTIGD